MHEMSQDDAHRPTALRLDDQLCFALYTATNTIIRAYRPLLRQIGLTYPQYLVMLVLWQDREAAIGEVASRLSLQQHALTPMLDRLEAAGFVARRRDDGDRRRTLVRLTPAGSALQAEAAAAQAQVVCETGMPDDTLTSLRDELKVLIRRMAATDGDRDANGAPDES